MTTTETVRAGIRAAGGSGIRLLIAGGLLFSALLLWLYLALFPGTGEGWVWPQDLYWHLAAHDDPTLVVLFFLSAGLLLWAVWSAVAGGALRMLLLGIRERPVTVGAALRYSLQRWASLFFTPILFFLAVASGALVVSAVASLTRVPAVGWPMFLLLSPLAVLIALVVVKFVARSLIGGHLAGPAIASGDCGAFAALARTRAWARREPLLLLRANAVALLLVLLHSAWRLLLLGAAFCLVGVFVDWRLTSGFAEFCAWFAVLAAACWLLAWPVSLLLGSRAGLYLAHRRELDGVDIDAAPAEPEREKSLEELGFELVEKLRKEED